MAFDLTFDQPQSGDSDRIFAEALRKSGNVVLCEYLRQQNLPLALAGAGIRKLARALRPGLRLRRGMMSGLSSAERQEGAFP